MPLTRVLLECINLIGYHLMFESTFSHIGWFTNPLKRIPAGTRAMVSRCTGPGAAHSRADGIVLRATFRQPARQMNTTLCKIDIYVVTLR